MVARERMEDGRRPTAHTDYLFKPLSSLPYCRDRNYMVCKDCGSGSLSGISLHAMEGDFEIWCFETGLFIGRVSAQLDKAVSNVTATTAIPVLCHCSLIDL